MFYHLIIIKILIKNLNKINGQTFNMNSAKLHIFLDGRSTPFGSIILNILNSVKVKP